MDTDTIQSLLRFHQSYQHPVCVCEITSRVEIRRTTTPGNIHTGFITAGFPHAAPFTATASSLPNPQPRAATNPLSISVISLQECYINGVTQYTTCLLCILNLPLRLYQTLILRRYLISVNTI